MENRGTRVIELNADIGEGCDDASLMPYLDRVSIACGGHAGDAASMAHAARLGLRLAHVKPHGALYNVAAGDAEVAQAIACAVARFDPGLLLIGLAGSRLVAAGEAAGLSVLNEGFADRRYQTDGRLVSRETRGALLTEPDMAAQQALALARGEAVAALGGGRLRIRVDTLCLHSDTPDALKIAQAIHAALNRG